MSGFKLFVIIFLFYGMNSLAQTTSPQDVKDFTLKIAKDCCSDAFEIITNEPASGIVDWYGVNNQTIDISNFGTVVHESVHGYDESIGAEASNKDESKIKYNGYFITKDIKVLVPRMEVFRTSELHPNYYPEEVQSLYRYGTYVHQSVWSSNMGNQYFSKRVLKAVEVEKGEAFSASNLDGILGLMDEFNGYYHGARAKFELTFSGLDIPENDSTGSFTAPYYEFNIFMAYYLKYAKENKPKYYNDIMSSKGLRTAYTLIETNWRDLLTTIYSNSDYAPLFRGTQGEDTLFTSELREVMNAFILPENELPEYQDFFKNRNYNLEQITSNRQNDEIIELPQLKEDFKVGITKSIDMSVGPKSDKTFYVVVKSNPSLEFLILSAVSILVDYKKCGVIQIKTNLHLYLDKFKTREKAEKYLRTINGKFKSAIII